MAQYDDDLDEAETGEAGPGLKEDDEDLLKRLKRWERLARNHASEWREEARLCYDFVAGHQWTSEDKAALLEQMRQPVTFNRTGPMVDAVLGAEILNRQEVTYSPREEGDVQVNELITAADKWARDLADTEDEESDAFADTVTCGMGWTETVMDYREDAEGRLVDDRVDPLEMWWDPQSRKRCLADRRYQVRARWRDRDDLPVKWRKKMPSSSQGSLSYDDMPIGHSGPRDDYERQDEPAMKQPADSEKRRVWIRHIQWWDLETKWRVADPIQGAVITVDQKQLKQLGEMFLIQGMRPPKAVKIEQKCFYEAFLVGEVILEKAKIEAGDFTFKCITGKRDRNKNTWFGIVRAMIDPQMWGNKFFVQIMHILNTAAKGGLMYETGALVNPQKAIEDWAKPDAKIELARGALANNAVQERLPRNYPQGLDRLMEFALNNLPQTSGVNLEMLGLVQREQPGVLEAQRKKAGYAILAVFFDSLRRYHKMKARVRLYFIQNYISDGRLVRIKGQDSTIRYVPLMRDKTVGTYDVVVDEAPMSPNQKEMVWQMLVGLMPMLSKLNVPPEVWGIMLEYSPLPSNVSGKINQIIQQKAQEPPPPDPEQVKAETQMKIAQQSAQLDAAGKQQDMQLSQQQAQQDAVARAQELQFEREKQAIELQGERDQLMMDRIKTAEDIQAARDKAAIGLQAAKAKAALAAKQPQQTRANA